MTAPAQLPVWATDGSNNTPPITTQQKSGWTPSSMGVSSYDNWYKELVYEWVRRFSARDVIDQFIPAIATATTPEMLGDEAPTDYIYALAPCAGQAFLRQGSTNAKLQIAPGILMQLRGGDLYAYRFDGTTEYTIANGDATNPRVDILQMKITCAVGDANPTVDVNVKQGTPAASPTYPAPDTGYCVIAGVVVGATYAGASGFKFDDTAGAVAVVHDQRMPLGVTPVRTMPTDFEFASGTDFSLVGSSSLVQAVSGTAHPMTIPVCAGTWLGRVLGHEVALYDSGNVTSHYVKRTFSDTGGGSGVTIANANLNSGYANGGGSSTFAVRPASFVNVQANHTPAAGPTVQANANGMGPPLWTNGRRAAGPRSTTFPANFESLALAVTADGGVEFGPVTFYVAGRA
jgi:hypothetical protein